MDGEDWASVKKNRGVGEDCGRKMIVAGCVAGMTDFLLTFDLSGVELLGKGEGDAMKLWLLVRLGMVDYDEV